METWEPSVIQTPALRIRRSAKTASVSDGERRVSSEMNGLRQEFFATDATVHRRVAFRPLPRAHPRERSRSLDALSPCASGSGVNAALHPAFLSTPTRMPTQATRPGVFRLRIHRTLLILLCCDFFTLAAVPDSMASARLFPHFVPAHQISNHFLLSLAAPR